MHTHRRHGGWILLLVMFASLIAPLSRAADSDDFPAPKSSRFT